MRHGRLRLLMVPLAVALTVLALPAMATSTDPGASLMSSLIPAPVSAHPDPKADFRIAPGTVISAPGQAGPVGDYLAGILRPATGYPLPVVPVSAPGIALSLDNAGDVGDQGYTLDVGRGGVVLRANTADGLFFGVQTLRQLLPAAVDSGKHVAGGVTVAGGQVTDRPRFAYRGAMLDVARHFYGVNTVRRYIDELARYKINYLHLHLTDDQGWRLQIDSWPRLTTYGGSTQVGGGRSGYYTKADYTNIVNYARSRHMTVVPEIDMPSHTNAALASYAELNCDGVAPALRTDTEVGYSSMCVDKDITYKFIDDVFRELAAITPGPYLHIGGDEAHSTPESDYIAFMRKAMPIAAKYGKKIQGWHQYLKATPPKDSVVQYWGNTPADIKDVTNDFNGQKLLVSPANKAYVDMQYNENTPLGLHWAGYVEVRDAYDWDPTTLFPTIDEKDMIGVEAPLWSETTTSLSDMEYLAFPRLPGIAEIGWSPKSTHDWADYARRLADQGLRWDAAGINYYQSSQVPWH